MTATWYDIVGGIDGAALSVTNYDPDINYLVVSGGSHTIKTTGGTFGAVKHIDSVGTTTSGIAAYGISGLSTDAYALGFEFAYSTPPTTDTMIGVAWQSGGTSRSIGIALTTTGSIRLRDAGASGGLAKWTATPAATSSAVLPANTKLYLTLYGTRNATTGTYRCVIYNLSTGAVVADSGLQTNINTGAASVTQIGIGAKASTGTVPLSIEVAGIAVDPAATDIIPLRLDTQLPTPIVTIDGYGHPTTIGGTDGFITFSWLPVSGASVYHVDIKPGSNVTTGFVGGLADSASPHTFTGLGDGPYTVAVKAIAP